MKKTLVIGASENPERYAYKATHKLLENGHEVVLLGLKEGVVAGVKIHTKTPVLHDIDTVTLYVGPKNQGVYLEYLCNLNPKRVIFNPGTENPEFQQQLTQKGIAFEESCTLVLLANGIY